MTKAMDYETVIGLEVHAQLLTRSKMFCGCSADYASAPPNTHVCPVCLALPGVLPVINRRAVEYTIMTALALHCTVAAYTKFDRKNYPYPDLMKGYQISQYDAPIGQNGWLDIEVNGSRKRIGITRVHLEEDVAKLLHRTEPGGETYSLVDVNRSGTPLMEIVGEPDLRSPEEARQYLVQLRSILQYLGVSTGNMEEGSFRCDANISIRPKDTGELLTKVEVKNMNSFRAVYHALAYEENRQRQVLARGERLVQETRGWVEEQGKTVSQRSKEYAHDYRYFPEPDLPPLAISREQVAAIQSRLPELPEARRDRFMAEYGLSLYDAALLTNTKEMADSLESLVKLGLPPKTASNWLLGEVSALVNAHNISLAEFFRRVSPANLAELVGLQSQKKVTTTTAKSVLAEAFASGKPPQEIIRASGLGQISDTAALEETIREVIQSNAQPVAEYRAGKEPVLKFLVGQVMKATGGRANPQLVSELLKEKLGNPGT